MATTRGKGTAARTRAPEDEISGTAAPEAAAGAPARGRGRRATPAETPAPDAPTQARGRRAAPGAGVTAADTPAADATTAAPSPRGGRRAAGTGVADAAPKASAAPAAPTASAAPKASAAPRGRGGRKKRETYTETAARRRKEKEVDQLQADLRAFAAGRPAGWNHDDWTTFLDHLRDQGHDVSDHQHIGARLERERLAVLLEGIEGLGPRRVHALTDRFQTLWSMRHAEAADVATVPGMTRPLAERVVQQLRDRYS